MNATLLPLLSFLSFSTGQYHTICQNQELKAEVGYNVTLQYRLDPPINLKKYSVECNRADRKKVVHLYRHRADHNELQMLLYRNKTTLNQKDLSEGIITLQISSVNQSFSGPYRCLVPKLDTSCTMTLNVGVKNDQNSTKRNDSGTETEPDAGKEWDTSTIVGLAVLAVFAVAVFISVLMNYGKIYRCIRLRCRRIRGGRTQDRGVEMFHPTSRNTSAAEEGGNQENPAETSSLMIPEVVVVDGPAAALPQEAQVLQQVN